MTLPCVRKACGMGPPMTLGVRHYFETYHLEFLRRASALVAIALLFSSLLCAVFAGARQDPHLSLQTPNLYVAFLDSRFNVYFSDQTYSQSLSPRADYQQPAASPPPTASSDIPAPVKLDTAAMPPKAPVAQHLTLRPPAFRQRVPLSQTSKLGTQSTERAENLSDGNTNSFQKFFAKLFGKPLSFPTRFASAASDDSQLPAGSEVGGFDEWTAVYDIAARTVYMPDGTKLEAHSGFGKSLDDPAQVAEKNLGPTPPNVYSLELREKPFHGVKALRLIPKNEEKALGRTGLLAHTFMLGPNGQSNGCVSFRDYDAFLHAYLDHRIKRLIVVASLN